MSINDKWQLVDGRLQRKFTFPDFQTSLAFVNRVGGLAEKANHHPDIKFGWGYAEISLFTHDAGKVTEKDRALAEQIDAI